MIAALPLVLGVMTVVLVGLVAYLASRLEAEAERVRVAESNGRASEGGEAE